MKNILLVLLLAPAIGFSQADYTYKNLALEGGGVRGLAYAGVINVLEQRNILAHIEKVAGSSAGAIAGLMICLDYSSVEIDSILSELQIEKFNDGNGGALGKYTRVKKNFGMYKGDRFENWLKSLVFAKTGIEELTFSGLHELRSRNHKIKDLYVTGTNISRQQLEIFSYEHTPDVPIALAVRISSGIPFYFAPVALDNQYRRLSKGDTSYPNYFVDGGMICNYPIGMFDSCDNKDNPLECFNASFNPQTLGIKLERPEQIDSLENHSIKIPPYDPQNLNEYFSAFFNLLMETLARKYPNLDNERGRTIYVSYGNVNSKVRRMKPEEKKLLYDNGVKAALSFFDNKNITTSSRTPF
ncbi:MAG: patatin-like phospholipase family protein [Ferruginibacter sp.]